MKRTKACSIPTVPKYKARTDLVNKSVKGLSLLHAKPAPTSIDMAKIKHPTAPLTVKPQTAVGAKVKLIDTNTPNPAKPPAASNRAIPTAINFFKGKRLDLFIGLAPHSSLLLTAEVGVEQLLILSFVVI